MARYKAVILAYLPNKSAQGRPASGWRIGFLVFFILLIFAGWFYFSSYKNKQVQYIADKEKSPLAVALDTTSQFDADSDGDGLKDWEELLWKTDPNKTDTDGDGTNDNEEITLNRNPLKAGPDDKISNKEDLVAQEKAVSDSKQNTLTASYARKFMTDYLALKTQKGELTEEDKSQLVVSFMNNLNPLSARDEYDMADLKIANDANDSVKKYAGEIKKVFIDDKQTTINDSLVFENFFQKIKDGQEYQEEIKDLNYSIAQYGELTEKMLSFSVPLKLREYHLETINGLNNIKFAIKNMILAPTDPIKAIMGRKLYDLEIQKISDAINNIQTIFNEHNIYVF